MYRLRRRSLLVMLMMLAFFILASGCGTGDTDSAEPPADAEASASSAVGEAELNQALSDSLPAAVKESGVLTLATDPTDPPLEFYEEGNELIGAEIDLANAIGQVLGVEIEFVPAKFDTIIPGIESGRYDGAVSGFADRPDRQKVVDFVDYFRTARGFLVQTGTNADIVDVADLCGKTVAVAAGTTMVDAMVELTEECKADGEPVPESQTFPDVSQSVLAVQSGRADVTVLPKHAALWIAEQAEGELDVVGDPQEGNDINGIALEKDAGLTEPIQGAIQQLMDNGIFLEIFSKWGLGDVALEEALINGGK